MSKGDDDRDGLVRQARQHFTQLDQVTQLVAAREADPEIGFMAQGKG